MNTDLHQQFVGDMLTESLEGLDRYDAAILLLEQGAASADTLNDVFRVVHTLKGTAGCLGFHHVERISHVGENLLDGLRAGQISVTPAICGGLLKLSDVLRRLLAGIADSGRDTAVEGLDALAEELRCLRERPAGAASAPVASPVAAAKAPETAPNPVPSSDAPVEPAAEGWGLFEDEPAAPAALTPSPGEPLPVVVTPVPGPRPEKSPAAVASADTSPVSAPAPIAAASVRVDVGLLDKLMNLVGELVLTRNQLAQLHQSRALKPETIAAVSQRLNLVTTELQEGVMKTRLQPIGTIWSKFPRIVRDIAHDLGKRVRLDTFGSETELDRTIIEAIRDPLTHVIRNSIDHGVESPEVRAAAGKSPEGQILMRAYHEGGQVNIEIIDDGAGIDPARVRRKALEKNLVTAEEAARLSEREVVNLVFLPGFSTAEAITNVSGRGVGMDVVRTNIEKIGGSVDLQSEPGCGTTLKIKIPLTLAIVPALIVRSGGERFAIPQVSLQEVVRLEGEGARGTVEHVCEAPVFRLRGLLLPLIHLHRELRLPTAAEGEAARHVVVLQADQRLFGLVVDGVHDTEEIVVKPLGKHLKGLPMFAGATIMGDGRVCLILDVLGLAQHAGLLDGTADRRKAQAAVVEETVGRSRLLLFSLRGRPRLAIPLEQASRLEEFPAERIEHSGGREAVQYRGRIMPIVRLARHLASAGAPVEAARLPVIVHEHGGRSVGLVVDGVHDIIEHAVQLQPGTAGSGILGSAVVQGRITDIVDLPSVLEAAGFPALARAA